MADSVILVIKANENRAENVVVNVYVNLNISKAIDRTNNLNIKD